MPRIAFLEWLDPPFSPGHWVPEMIHLAGGIDVLGSPRKPARRLSAQEIDDADPDITIAAPCGYSPMAMAKMVEPDMLPAGARFDRPGPGLIDSLEWLAETVKKWQQGCASSKK